LAIFFLKKIKNTKIAPTKIITNRPGRSPHYTSAPSHWTATAKMRTAVVRAPHRTGALRTTTVAGHCHRIALCVVSYQDITLTLGRPCRPCETLALGCHCLPYETLALGCRCETLALGRHCRRCET